MQKKLKKDYQRVQISMELIHLGKRMTTLHLKFY